MPLVVAQLSNLVLLLKYSTQTTVNADAQQSKHAVVDSFGMLSDATVFKILMLDVLLVCIDLI